MGSLSVNERKIKVKTQAKVLGKTEVDWDIVGWGGPMGHQLRSRATCDVTIPTSQTTTSELRLRFHLQPYQSHEEPDQKFCNQRIQYVSRSIDCSCYTCKKVPLSATTAELPPEFMPKCPTRSAGYSLLVDVLNAPQNEVTLGVSGKILNGNDSAIPFQNFVTVDPASSQKDISVIKNFCPMVQWTEDKSGNISNCVKIPAIADEDARFVLTVTAYQIEEIGTDTNPPLTATVVTPTFTAAPGFVTSINEHSNANSSIKVIWNGTLELVCKDVDSFGCQRQILETCKAMALIDDENSEMIGNDWPSKLKIDVRRMDTLLLPDGLRIFDDQKNFEKAVTFDIVEVDKYGCIGKMLQYLSADYVGVFVLNGNADTEGEHLATATASVDRALLFSSPWMDGMFKFHALILKEEPSRTIIRNIRQNKKI